MRCADYLLSISNAIYLLKQALIFERKFYQYRTMYKDMIYLQRFSVNRDSNALYFEMRRLIG